MSTPADLNAESGRPLRPGDNPLADQLIEENERLRRERNGYYADAYTLRQIRDRAASLLAEVLTWIEDDPYDPRGGIAEELREIEVLLNDGEACRHPGLLEDDTCIDCGEAFGDELIDGEAEDPSVCNANAYFYAVDGIGSPGIDSFCRKDLADNGVCWCGKLDAARIDGSGGAL